MCALYGKICAELYGTVREISSGRAAMKQSKVRAMRLIDKKELPLSVDKLRNALNVRANPFISRARKENRP